MNTALCFPRNATAYNVVPIRRDLYDTAYRAALDAGADWPRMLGYAETLAHSPLPAHTSLARHIRTAYSMHMADILKQVNPAHRDRSDMIDVWRESALRAEAEEIPVKIAMRHRSPLMAVCAGALLAVLAAAMLHALAVLL